MKSLVGIILALMVMTAESVFGADSQTTTAKAKDVEVVKTPWGFSAYGEHYMGFSETIDAESLIKLGASYKLNQKNSLSVSQWISKYYVIKPGDSEVALVDTTLGHTYKFGKGPLGVKFALTSQMTLPVSEASRTNKVISKPRLLLAMSKKFGVVSVKVVPFFRYYLNRFKTTPTSPGGDGGNPLLQYFGGAYTTVEVSANKWLSFNGTAYYGQVGYEKINKINAKGPTATENPSKHKYIFDLGAGVQATKKVSVYLGFAQENWVETRGGRELLLFDDQASLWYLGTGATF